MTVRETLLPAAEVEREKRACLEYYRNVVSRIATEGEGCIAELDVYLRDVRRVEGSRVYDTVVKMVQAHYGVSMEGM